MVNRSMPSANPDYRDPLHPAVVHFPIAFFPLSTLFLVIWFWSGKAPFFLLGAYWSYMLGVLSLVPVALTGLVDLQHLQGTDEKGEKLLTFHIMFGVIIALIAIGGAILFLLHKPFLEMRYAPWFVAISILLSVLILFQGYIGGKLVYKHSLGVKETT